MFQNQKKHNFLGSNNDFITVLLFQKRVNMVVERFGHCKHFTSKGGEKQNSTYESKTIKPKCKKFKKKKKSLD